MVTAFGSIPHHAQERDIDDSRDLRGDNGDKLLGLHTFRDERHDAVFARRPFQPKRSVTGASATSADVRHQVSVPHNRRRDRNLTRGGPRGRRGSPREGIAQRSHRENLRHNQATFGLKRDTQKIVE
ncbi:MAG: hypothetical protein QOC73_2330 [Actinomycetota bacterium]|jgi:hypothetical protein|nr:hypothetical protein [Actinomycetota bacterium]